MAREYQNKAGSVLKVFGQAVRSRREKLGISQEELADRAGLHRTYIGDIERGRRNVALRNICRLARALEVPPAELLSECAAADAGE